MFRCRKGHSRGDAPHDFSGLAGHGACGSVSREGGSCIHVFTAISWRLMGLWRPLDDVPDHLLTPDLLRWCLPLHACGTCMGCCQDVILCSARSCHAPDVNLLARQQCVPSCSSLSLPPAELLLALRNWSGLGPYPVTSGASFASILHLHRCR